MKVKSSDFSTLYNEVRGSAEKYFELLDEEQHSNADGIRNLDELKLRIVSKELILKINEMAAIQEASEKRRGIRVRN